MLSSYTANERQNLLQSTADGKPEVKTESNWFPQKPSDLQLTVRAVIGVLNYM